MSWSLVTMRDNKIEIIKFVYVSYDYFISQLVFFNLTVVNNRYIYENEI